MFRRPGCDLVELPEEPEAVPPGLAFPDRAWERGVIFLLLLALGASVAPARGQSEKKSDAAKFPPVKLTIYPAKPTVPALKYLFYYELHDQQPGNAALLYHRAVNMWRERRLDSKAWEQIDAWSSKPISKLTAEDIKQMTARKKNILAELDLAARKRRCDWELDDRKEGISLMLPEIQGQREIVHALVLQIRADMARGKLQQSLANLRSGFALAKNTGEGPTLIQALVGIAISQIMLKQVEDLVQLRDAPNLYWALTAMPTPFISLRKPMQGEKGLVYNTFIKSRDLENRILSPQEIRLAFHDFMRQIGLMGYRDGFPQFQLGMIALSARTYPEAKRALIAQGRKKADVEAMPVLQVVSLYSLGQYRELQDEVFKWLHVPFPQAQKGLRQATQKIKQYKVKYMALPYLLLMPAIEKVLDANLRTERRFAVLRCIEALRLYAGKHQGKLPATLADITDVPVPNDPVTGKPFGYKRNDAKATLSGPAPQNAAPSEYNQVNYELTIKK